MCRQAFYFMYARNLFSAPAARINAFPDPEQLPISGHKAARISVKYGICNQAVLA